jgi:hypothetical protein
MAAGFGPADVIFLRLQNAGNRRERSFDRGAGSGKGPAVVMIDGFGDTGDMWFPLARNRLGDLHHYLQFRISGRSCLSRECPVIYLASDDSAFVTGTASLVDGVNEKRR